MSTLPDKTAQDDLERAFRLFQNPSLTARIADVVGSPLESLVNKLPNTVVKGLHKTISAALAKAYEGALMTMRNRPGEEAWTATHKLAAAVSGGLGGFFGLGALLVELPVSTTIMLRAIADVANSEGFDLDCPATRQSCLAVLSLGGDTADDDGTDSGYYMARAFVYQSAEVTAAAMAKAAAEQAAKAAAEQAAKAAAEQAAKGAAAHAFRITPTQAGGALAALIEKVATRYGIVITEKIAAQSAPVIGAVTGVTLNTLFTNHYQDMARAFFIMRRLEDAYGNEVVKRAYDALKKPRPVKQPPASPEPAAESA